MAIRVTEIACGQLTNIAAAVGTLPVQRFNKLGFSHTGLSTETLTIQVSFDGGATWTTGATLAVNPIAGGAAVTTIPTTASVGYSVNLPACTHIKFVKSAAAQTAVISYTLSQS